MLPKWLITFLRNKFPFLAEIKNIVTTQIYAKIIDQKKDDAVNRFDEIFK